MLRKYMKIYSLIILIIVLFLLSCKTNKIVKNEIVVKNKSNDFTFEFEIFKTDSIDNVYLIYVKRNNSIFKIASDKEKNIKCNSIKKGEIYN
jgi:hypothetical protein